MKLNIIKDNIMKKQKEIFYDFETFILLFILLLNKCNTYNFYNYLIFSNKYKRNNDYFN